MLAVEVNCYMFLSSNAGTKDGHDQYARLRKFQHSLLTLGAGADYAKASGAADRVWPGVAYDPMHETTDEEQCGRRAMR